MVKFITKKDLDKINIHERFAKKFNIPEKVLINILVELDTNWGLGYNRFEKMSKKLSLVGIKITGRQIRYIHRVYNNYKELNFKLKKGGKILANFSKTLYGKT